MQGGGGMGEAGGGIGVNGVEKAGPENKVRRDAGDVWVPWLTPVGEKKLDEAMSENVLDLSWGERA